MVQIKKISVMGCHLITWDGYYIVGIDYDKFRIDFLKVELKKLQKDFGLSDFWIVETSKEKYHAICFDKVPVLTYRKILDNTHADFIFSTKINFFGEPKVLRLPIQQDKKIKIYRVKSDWNNWREQSTAHKNLYSRFKIIPFVKTAHDDNNNQVSLVFYNKILRQGNYARAKKYKL